MTGRQHTQDWRCTKVEIGTEIFRTVIRRVLGAADEPGIVLGVLNVPQDLAGLHVDCHHGIGRLWGRFGVGIAGRDIKDATRGINRGGMPHGGACRRVELCSRRILARRPGAIGNRIGLPDHSTAGRIQRQNAAAKCAARVVHAAACGFLSGRDRDVESPCMKRRGSGDGRERMRIGDDLPQHLASGGVQRVHVGPYVAEVDGVPRARHVGRSHADGVSHAGLCLKGPVDASGRRVEGVHVAGIDTDEDFAARNRGLSVHRGDAWKAESPFELQPRHLFGRKTAAFWKRALVASATPSVPGWVRREIAETSIGRAAVRHHACLSGLRGAKLAAAQELGHCTLDVILDVLDIQTHRTARDGLKDRLRRHLAERCRLGRTFDRGARRAWICVAGGATLVNQANHTRRRLCGRALDGDQQDRYRADRI